MNLADWIDRWAGFAPEKTAIRLEGRLLSYAAMADEIARLAGVLRNDLAIEPGDRVAFVGFNSPENLLLLFACARVGAILLPLNWRLAAPEHSYIVNDCTPKALFAGADFVVQVESNRDSIGDMHLISCGGETPPGWHSYADLVGGVEPLPRGPGALGDTVLICYTSGTTGQPKGTLLDQNALSWTAVNGAHMHDLTSADLILSTLPLFHVGGLNIQTLPALHAGATVELHAKFDPADALHAIAERRPTLAVLVPAQLQAMMALPEWESTDLSCFRMVSTGSTFVSLPLIRAIHARGVPLIQVYGSTETAPTAVFLRAEDAVRKEGSCGKPAMHCEMRIVDEDGNDVAPGESGEIVIRGANVMSGYWNLPEATAAVLVDGWYHTGDVGHVDDEGFLFIDDRKKDVIISGGENVYPAELENVLAGSPQIPEAAVVGRPDARWGEVPAAAPEVRHTWFLSVKVGTDMTYRIGIDVGSTFTDFFVTHPSREPVVAKVLSTPLDPSIAVIEGLTEIAGGLEPVLSLEDFASQIDTIVHGTTVTTNATLTRNGAKSGLITIKGVRDALEMRRGIREEQYNNRYTNVKPLVPRYLRHGVTGRLDRNGNEVEALGLDEMRAAIYEFKREGVEAVSICFMNAFANPAHERAAAELVRAELPGAYLTVSTDLLPSIRFYERVSTTALNSYIGPILDHYLNQLTGRLKQAGFNGILLIMQSNSGVMSPEVARQKAALTLLSGPAAGPGAGLEYARAHDQSKCIVVDMGGTSFEAALVVDSPIMVNDGQIDRHRIALPMLGIHTIGAGGGSIGWIDEGGLLRMGPQSAGADPGPACYAKGGELPATTDANVVLGYLDPNYFAGGKMSLDVERARRAIETHVAKPLGLSIEAAAAGMYRIACTNMAQGVREVSIKRGFDAHEFPLVVAGGAGPIHSCLICDELEVPLQIVPRESSILCAVGMLMSDLKHDFVRTFVSPLYSVDWTVLRAMIEEMVDEGDGLLDEEGIGRDRRSHAVKFDCRYLKQYHEVSFVVPPDALAASDADALAAEFHREHNCLYGYSLEDQAVPIEIINVRTQAMGRTERPEFRREPFAGTDPSAAKKGERRGYIPEREGFETVPVYDGHALRHGNLAVGPAIIEEVTTAIFVGSNHDCVCDSTGSFVMYRKDRADLAERILEGGHA